MKYVQCYTLVAVISILMGCGGGGESNSKSVDPAPTPVISEQPVDKAVEKTADIVADAEFDFSTKFYLNLDAKLAGLNQRAYLNVCLAPEEGEKVNLNSCLFRSPLSSNGLTESILVSHSEVKLIAQIWFYDGSTTPLQYEWQYQGGQAEQSFLIR